MRGVDYLGFVKRVYNAGDPSVNHLIIVEDTPGVEHQFATNTNDDFHRVFFQCSCLRPSVRMHPIRSSRCGDGRRG